MGLNNNNNNNNVQNILPNAVTPPDMAVIEIDNDFKPIKPPKLKKVYANSPEDAVKTARSAFNSGKTKDLKFREQQLKALYRMYLENADEMCDVMLKDFRKCRFETVLYEVETLKNDLINLLKNLKSYAKPEYKDVEVKYIVEKLMVYHDPYGVVLIIGAWNYPLQLSLLPFAGAIAAGNCVILKPSELASHSAKFMAQTIPKYLDNECYQIIEGGVPETTKLLEQKFDYIFFTGSSTVGKIVHQAAAKNLTPTALELGGKSPVYIHKSADIEITTKRILWGKMVNAGQTCIAPDYILCTKEVETGFIYHAKKYLKQFFGENVQDSPDFCRIVNARNFDRLINLMKNAKVAIGGHFDPKELYIEPTVLINVSPNHPIMQEEIFGPIIPIVTVDSEHDAITFINAREKPLALYVFSNDNSVTDYILNNTSSGGACVNDTLMHIVCENLPFGGVGNSGMGSYHGKQSFDTFVHKKSVMKKPGWRFLEHLYFMRYPPYSEGKLSLVKMYMKKRINIPDRYFAYVFVFLLGFAFAHLWWKFVLIDEEDDI